MKKHLLLFLLFTGFLQAQTYPVNPTKFGKISLNTNIIDTTAVKVNVQSSDNTINTIPKSDLIEVLEYASAINLPVTGKQGKIYVTKDDNKLYRWNGTVYVLVSDTDISTKENTSNKDNGELTSSSITFPTSGAVKSYIDSKIPATYAKVVYVNATSPNTATIFDLNNPPITNDNALKIDTANLYIGSDASTWVYNGSTYVTKTIPSTSNFYIEGVGIDAGNDKTSNLQRTGGAVFGGYLYTYGEIVSKKASSDTVLFGSNLRLLNNAGSEGNVFQLNASNGIDLWNFASGTWNKRFTFSSLGYLTANNFIKSGGTSSQFLKADGSVDATTYAPLASPTFTGTPTAPTATVGTNTTQIATTAFVLANSSSGGGDMVLASAQTNTGTKTFLNGSLGLRNVANTFTSYFTNLNTASRTYTFPDKSGNIFIDADFTVFGSGTGNTGIGISVLSANTTGYNNTAVGNSTLNANTTGFQNTAIGFWALKSNITGSANTAFGYRTLYLNTGSSNTGVGNNTLENNSTGGSNTAIGNDAMNLNTSASFNTAIGSGALKNNLTGGSNVSIGYNSLLNNTGTENTAIGVNSSGLNTSGVGNFSGGYNALYANTSGSYNVTLGHNSARFISDGATNNAICNNSVFIGTDVKALASNQTNQIVIGYNAIGAGSNTATLGNTSIIKTVLQGVVNTPKTYTVATLPTGVLGDTTIATDLLAPTYMATAVGGGAITWKVFFDGTSWKVD